MQSAERHGLRDSVPLFLSRPPARPPPTPVGNDRGAFHSFTPRRFRHLNKKAPHIPVGCKEGIAVTSSVFDRQVFDGEIGWATDKAMHFAGLRDDDIAGCGPNYGQIFDDHIQVYSSILAASSEAGTQER